MPRSAWPSNTCASWTSCPAARRRSTWATGTTWPIRPPSSRTPPAGWPRSPARPGSITEDPGEFAIAALQVATGPIMSPGYVRWHPRVLDYKLDRGLDPEPGRLVCTVTLATSLPLWLGSPWWSWTERLGDPWCDPDDTRHAALARLELRWPIPDATLPHPHPHRPATPGPPHP